MTSRLADPLLDAVAAEPGVRVLDVATGPGYVAGRAAERGADAVGLDISEAMLDAVAQVGAAPPVDVPSGPPRFGFAEDARFAALLTEAGLTDVVVESITVDHEIDHADALWDGLIDGTVRVGPLVRGQPEPVARAIRERFDELLDDYRAGTGFEVPVAVKLASGRRP